MRGLTLLLIAAVVGGSASAQPTPASLNVRDFGAVGDGVADDTPAIRAAFEAAKPRTISEQPIPGQSYVASLPTVYFPNGKYRLSEPLVPTANMLGEGNAILYQPDAGLDIIAGDWVWRWRISGFSLLGGRNQLHLGNPNIDTGRIIVEKCNFQDAAGAAIRIREGSNSTQLTVEDCIMLYCDQALVNYCDMAKVADTWVTTAPGMRGKAAFENHGLLLLEHVLGVPLVTPENDQRWIDNYGGVTCRNMRFGGEGAGFTAVVNWVRYTHTYPVIPSFVILDACHVYALGNPQRKAAIYCEEVPNQIVVRDCNGFPDLPVVQVSDRLDLGAYFQDARQRGDACLRFFIGAEQVELRLRELPEAMRPFEVH
jgi:hypothetical protein